MKARITAVESRLGHIEERQTGADNDLRDLRRENRKQVQELRSELVQRLDHHGEQLDALHALVRENATTAEQVGSITEKLDALAEAVNIHKGMARVLLAMVALVGSAGILLWAVLKFVWSHTPGGGTS